MERINSIQNKFYTITPSIEEQSTDSKKINDVALVLRENASHNASLTEDTAIDQRLQRQQAIGVNRWCSVPWKDGRCLGLLIEYKDEFASVKIMDSSLPIEEWPIHDFATKDIKHCVFEKCTSMDELISNLQAKKILSTQKIEEAFRKVDRRWFCKENPYFDAAIDIDCNMCISAPHMHIWSLELCKDLFSQAENILDVGTGTGYIAAILAQLCPKAKVIGVDCFEILIMTAQKTCASHLSPEINERIRFEVGNGEKGFIEAAPYDIINVGFMCKEIPSLLVEQLKPGGKLIIPVGTKVSSYDSRLLGGNLVVVSKSLDGTIKMTNAFPCSFIPSQAPKAHLRILNAAG